MKTNKIVSMLVVLFFCLGCDTENSGANDGSHTPHQPNLCSVPGETECTGEIAEDDAGFISYHFGGIPFGRGPVRVVSCTCDNGCPNLYTVPLNHHSADAFCQDADLPPDGGTVDAGSPCQEPDVGHFATFYCPYQPDAK
jgi:hypothetical protein